MKLLVIPWSKGCTFEVVIAGKNLRVMLEYSIPGDTKVLQHLIFYTYLSLGKRWNLQFIFERSAMEFSANLNLSRFNIIELHRFRKLDIVIVQNRCTSCRFCLLYCSLWRSMMRLFIHHSLSYDFSSSIYILSFMCL